MQVGGVQVPGSQAFKYGTGITAGIVIVAGIVNALLGIVPFLGLLSLIIGPAAAIIGGAIGAYKASEMGGITEGGEAAKLGAVTGGLGNFLGGIVATIIGLVVGLVLNVGGSAIGGGSGGDMAMAAGVGILGAIIGGGIGVISGTVIALVGGVIGGFVYANR